MSIRHPAPLPPPRTSRPSGQRFRSSTWSGRRSRIPAGPCDRTLVRESASGERSRREIEPAASPLRPPRALLEGRVSGSRSPPGSCSCDRHASQCTRSPAWRNCRRDPVGAQCHRLGEIGRGPETSRGDQRDARSVARIQVSPRPRDGGHGRHRYVVPEDQRRRARPPSAPIENHVVHSDLECRVEILLDVLRRQLEADRNTAGPLSYLRREIPVVVETRPVRKPGRRHRRLPVLQSSDLGDLSFHLFARKMPAGTGLSPPARP